MESVQKYLDESGKVKVWPKRSADKEAVVGYLASKFELGRTYNEKEVNEVVLAWHSFADHTMLRRELIERAFLARTPDCKEYRKTEKV